MNDEVEDHNDANSVANEPILDTVQVSDVFEESVQTTKPLSLLQQIALAGVEFSFQAHIAALMVVLIPARVVQFVGPDKKGSFLAVIVFGGAGLACVLGPVFGYLSDNTRFKYVCTKVKLFKIRENEEYGFFYRYYWTASEYF